jgi:hypothetical protein
VLRGPAFRRAAAIDTAHVLDLTPTLLHLQGLPAADDMPGRVLLDAFDEGFRAALPERRIPTYDVEPRSLPAAPAVDPEVDAALREKLEALGYLGGGQ